MIVFVLSPYEAISAPGGAGTAPAIFGAVNASAIDVTGNPLDSGIPGVNLVLVQADLTGQQLASVTSDNRFFVLPPAANTKAALRAYLNARGASVTINDSDSNQRVADTLKEYLRAVQ